MAGRPTDYTEELADLICERIALGESLRSICEDEDIPAMSTVFKWLNEHTQFSEQYARAREEQAEAFADEIVTIADDAAPDGACISKAKLQIEARKWTASKLKPKKYGDKIAVGGADDLPPIKSGVDASKLSKEALKELMDARPKQE